MSRPIRALLIVLLALFAAGTAAHAASASMSVAMMLAGESGSTMPDCDGCGTDGDGGDVAATCDTVCVAPLAATADAGPSLTVPFVDHRYAEDAGAHTGRTGDPDPYPPRPFIHR